MSSREARKQEARAAREAREEEAASRDRRARRLRLLGLTAAAAAALVVVAIVVSGGEDDPVTGDEAARVVQEVVRDLDGIPQDGTVLGRRDAAVTMLEFADPQCPFCGEFATKALPELVAQDVRSGRLRVELHLLTFLDDTFGTEDSEKIARLALAAGEQDRLWHVVEGAFRLQGQEGSGYATDEFLRALVTDVPGLDAEKALADMDSPAVDRALAAARTAQGRYGIESTPSFLIGRTGGDLEPFQPPALEAGPFRDRIGEVAGGS